MKRLPKPENSDPISEMMLTPAEPPNGEYSIHPMLEGLVEGKQLRAKFPNGHSASVISGPFAFGGRQGLYELAAFDQLGMMSDPIGHLTPEEVIALLHKIAHYE